MTASLKKYLSYLRRLPFELKYGARCREAFSSAKQNERASSVMEACGDSFACEQVTVSRHSPGPVLPDETLNLLISDPQGLLDKGKLHPALFSQISKKGMSVLRGGASDDEFKNTFLILSENGNERYLHGIGVIKAECLRMNDGVQRLGVFDSGYKDRPHHADVVGSMDRKGLERIRRDLVGQITVVPVSEFRSGMLMHFARPE